MRSHSTDHTMTRRSVLLAPMALVGAVSVASRGAPLMGFCIGTYGMKDLPIDAALRLIASTGYDGVELSLMPEWQCDPAKMSAGDRRRLRALLGETRLALAALNEALLITAETRTRNLERLRLAADLAHYLAPGEPPVIETMLGGKTADASPRRQSEAEDLRRLLPHVRRLGIAGKQPARAGAAPWLHHAQRCPLDRHRSSVSAPGRWRYGLPALLSLS